MQEDKKDNAKNSVEMSGFSFSEEELARIKEILTNDRTFEEKIQEFIERNKK